MQFSAIFQPIQPKLPYTHWKNASIFDPNTFKDIQCQLLIDQNNHLYVKLTQKSNQIYQTTSKSKIQPVYTLDKMSKPLLDEIKLHENYQYLTIRSQNKKDLEQIYDLLKKQISHKGFSDYFKPIKRLGKGAFATVYLIEHKITKKQYAAKVFSRQGQKLEFKGKQALENQIRILRTLSHPNIIKYEGLYQTQNLIYLVTQHLSGGTLDECMRDKCKLTQEVISNVLKDTLNALSYLQKHHIIHRDLKPENILLRTQDKKWVIIDFGLSAFSNQNYLYEKCGTLGYIAPQIMKQTGNQQNKINNSVCDLYSLGIIAYELIFGTLPFKVQSQGIFEKKVVWNAFKNDQSSLLPQQVKRFLEGLLETDPKVRFSAKDALNSRIFSSKEVIEQWQAFGKKKRDERYERILKMANIN